MTTNKTTLMNSNTMITSSTPCDKHYHDNEEPMNITMVIRSNMTMSKKVFAKKPAKEQEKQENKNNNKKKCEAQVETLWAFY